MLQECVVLIIIWAESKLRIVVCKQRVTHSNICLHKINFILLIDDKIKINIPTITHLSINFSKGVNNIFHILKSLLFIIFLYQKICSIIICLIDNVHVHKPAYIYSTILINEDLNTGETEFLGCNYVFFDNNVKIFPKRFVQLAFYMLDFLFLTQILHVFLFNDNNSKSSEKLLGLDYNTFSF